VATYKGLLIETLKVGLQQVGETADQHAIPQNINKVSSYGNTRVKLKIISVYL
jgi:hypothetical protein